MLSRYLAAARTVRPVAVVPGPRYYAIRPKPVTHPENEEIVRGLEKCREQEDLTKLSKTMLSRGINIVAAHPRPIRTLGDVSDLERLSPTVRMQICTILKTKHGDTSDSPDMNFALLKQRVDGFAAEMKHLMAVRGLGPPLSLPAFGANITICLCATPEFMEMLPGSQRLAAAYHYQTILPVTRELTEDLQAFMRDSLPMEWDIVPVGEYRRGISECTALRFLLLNPGYRHVEVPTMPKRNRCGQLSRTVGRIVAPQHLVNTIMTDDLVRSLERRRLLVGRYKSLPSVWLGVVRIPGRESDGDWESLQSREAGLKNHKGVFRDAEFTIIAAKSKGAALLKHTGDEKFFEYLRTRADERGLFLNGDGLWRFHEQEPHPDTRPVAAAPPRQTSPSKHPGESLHGYWELLPSATEEQILEELDIAWIEPDRRNFEFLKR